MIRRRLASLGSEWSLATRVTVLWVLSATVLGAMAIAAIAAAAENRNRMQELFDEVGPMRAASYDLRHVLEHQHDSVHSFALDDGRVADLRAYRLSLRREAALVAAIAANPAATPDILHRLSIVEQTAAQWRREAAEPAIAARIAGDMTSARTYLSDGNGVRFRDVSMATEDLQASITALRDTSAEAIKSTGLTVLVVTIVGLTFVLAAGVVLILALQRGVVRPLTDLAARVRRVADGCPDTVISATGAPELRRLGADVEAMRQQIAADLAEVEHARQELEHAHALLERQATELARSNQDLEHFAFVASHDLREPLHKIASFCGLLQHRYDGQLDERAQQYIAYAVDGARRMQGLVDGLLEFSRVGRVAEPGSSGPGEPLTRVDLNRVVAAQVAHLNLDSGLGTNAASATVRWHGLPVVRGNEVLIGRLLANLISNGVKFHRPGVAATVMVSARRVGAFWEVSCVDDGIGIGKEHADKAFAIFGRLHGRDAYPGTGMGLAIAKRIVEHHGGAIWIDTAYTAGTAVRFTLPAMATPGQTVNDLPLERSAAPTAKATASANGATSD